MKRKSHGIQEAPLMKRSTARWTTAMAAAALIGLPAAAHPEGMFDLAATRAEEIIIGVLAPALVQSLLFPQSVASVMTEKLDDVIRRARSRISEGLRAPTPAGPAMPLTGPCLRAWRPSTYTVNRPSNGSSARDGASIDPAQGRGRGGARKRSFTRRCRANASSTRFSGSVPSSTA